TFTSEANGWPVLRSSVASVPARMLRRVALATVVGLKSAGGCAFSGRRAGMVPGKTPAGSVFIDSATCTVCLISQGYRPFGHNLAPSRQLMGSGAGPLRAAGFHVRQAANFREAACLQSLWLMTTATS